MARAAETIDQHRFTVEEYHRMAETRIFKPDERVELIRGVVRRMSRQNYAHIDAATKLHQRLVKSLAGRASVFKEDPLKLVRLDSEPEPDILAISSPNIEDYGKESYGPVLVMRLLHRHCATTSTRRLPCTRRPRFPSIGCSTSSIGSSWSFALPKKVSIETVPPTAPGTVSLQKRGQTS